MKLYSFFRQNDAFFQKALHLPRKRLAICETRKAGGPTGTARLSGIQFALRVHLFSGGASFSAASFRACIR